MKTSVETTLSPALSHLIPASITRIAFLAALATAACGPRVLGSTDAGSEVEVSSPVCSLCITPITGGNGHLEAGTPSSGTSGAPSGPDAGR